MEAFSAGTERFGERRHADRQEHELLEVDACLRMGAAVQHVELRHRQHHRPFVAETAIQRQALDHCGCVTARQAHREDGVGTEVRLVRRAVKRDHPRVERRLVHDIEPHQLRTDHADHVGECVAHALAAVALWVAIAKLDGLVDPRAGAAGHPRASLDTARECHHRLERRVAARVEDLERRDSLE